MKIQIKKIYLYVIPFLFLLSTGAKAILSLTDFSGIWKIDYSKSEFGGAPHFTAAKQITIKQNYNAIDIERIQDSRIANNPDTTVIEKLTFDGTVYGNITSRSQKKSSKMVCSDDGKKFKIETTVTLPDNDKQDYRQLEEWSLTEAGKTLLVNKIVENSDGFKYTVKAVYNRK